MNSCYLCHLHSCVLSLICFYQIHLHLCICISSVLVSQSDDWESPAFRFVVGTFVVVNGTFPLKVWRFPWKNAARPARRQTKLPAVREGRCSRYGSAIFAHFVCWELTFLFWINLSTFFRSFRSSISLRKFIEIFLLSSIFGKVLIT